VAFMWPCLILTISFLGIYERQFLSFDHRGSAHSVRAGLF